MFKQLTTQGGDGFHKLPMVKKGKYWLPNFIIPTVLNYASEVVLNHTINHRPVSAKIFRDFLRTWDWMLRF